MTATHNAWKRVAGIGCSALLCATMMAPASAFAEEASVTAKSETVKVDMTPSGEVENAELETLVKYADGDSETTTENAQGQLPVAVKVTYRLDGREVAPEDIAGSSGEVSIRYDYENASQTTVSADDATVTVYTPFTAITALMLDDGFSDVEVSNGRIIDDEEGSIVVGYAFPGLKESLGDLASDADIPDFFEVRAKAQDFELKTSLTIVTAGLFSEVDADDLTLGEIGEVPAALAEATQALIDGSSSLTSGLNELSGAGSSLHEGAGSLSNGAYAFAQATQSAASASSGLSAGINKFNGGLNALIEGDGTPANPGIAGLSQGLAALNQSLSSYRSQSLEGQSEESVDPQLSSLRRQLEKIAAESGDDQSRLDAQRALDDLSVIEAHVQATSDSLNAQAGEAQVLASTADSLNGLSAGLDAQVNGLKALAENGKGLESGAKQLEGGMASLADQSSALANGASSLENGSGQMANGLKSAAEGSQQLTDGLKAFNDEGISSINDAITNRYAALLARMRALVQAAKDYRSFSGADEEISGDVKFVYETAPISKES